MDELADTLRAALEGEVIGPEDAGFDRARRTFNAMVDARPAAIARCASREDVARATAVARERGLPLAIRAGGTSDRATVDGGVVIDLSPLDAIEIDVAARTARVGAGITWGELDAATQAHGLAVTGARLSALGVAGVALGAGSGWLERALGPTGASLIGAEVVLADGRVVEAAGDADLPGLGVVTRLDLALHPVGPTLLCGFLGFPRERAAEVARGYRDVMAQASDEVGGGLLLGAGLGGACTLVFSYLGPIEDGEAAVAPLRALRPSLDAVALNPYVAFQRIWDTSNPPGTRVRLASALLAELSDESIDALVARANQPAATLSYVFLRPLGGALATDAAWEGQCVGLWPPVPALDAGQIAWVDGFAQAVAPCKAVPDSV
jgi:FAD binding domain